MIEKSNFSRRPTGESMLLSRRSFLAGAASLVAARVQGAPKTLRAGCQANGWNLDPAKFDLLLTAVREMKELGFQGFETNIRIVQPQLDRLAEARAALDQIGLEFIAAHTSVPNYEKLGMEQSADQISRLVDQARQFGAHALVVSQGGLSKTGQFTEEALDRKAQMLNLAGRRCADGGLTLAYHNHQPEFQNHAAEELGLLRKTDPKLVFLMLDIGHAWLADPDAISVFASNPERAFGLHVRDFHNRESVPLGQGEFPLRELATVIRRTGWSGWLIDEEERPNEPDKPGKKAAGPSRKTMKEVFGV
jgi:sugar phosphate isomerase/epimerase